MNILEVYKEKNNNPTWFDRYSSLAKGSSGRFFEYTNTNFRKQDSFITQFSEFLVVENSLRSQWAKQASHGQERDKHRVINMLQSKLFKRDSDNLYSRTAKGKLYSTFIESQFKDQERWFLNYLFLLNGYYMNQKNYILKRVREDLSGKLISVDGVDKNLIIDCASKLLRQKDFKEILRTDFFYLHSFYDDSDFIIKYLRSSEKEKEDLAIYIESNYTNANYVCCISQKYKPGGNFNKQMLIDEVKVFLLTFLFIQSPNSTVDNAIDIFATGYQKYINEINKKQVLDYAQSHRSIFEPILEEILGLDSLHSDSVEDLYPNEEVLANIPVDEPETYIDETDEVGRQKIKALFSIRKKQAKQESGYRCALENINNCKPIYFTAKTNNQNYLELHHFIPREFRNDFAHSIEVLANYVTLCPRCHRQIHLAVDRERKSLINALFNERKVRLDTVGLFVTQLDIYEYYKISD